MIESLRSNEHFIGGRWVSPAGPERMTVRSPHDRSVLADVTVAGGVDIARAVETAAAAFRTGEWPRTTPSERIALVRRLADRYTTVLDEMATLISLENGSPITFSHLGQAGAVPPLFDGFLRAAEQLPWEEPVQASFGPQVVRREPVGVVGAITAWNVPQMLIVAKLAPALLAGCTIVIKASPDAALDALRLAALVEEVGFPPGVVSILVGGADAGRTLVSHPAVDKVAFTGSAAVGSEIGAVCGRQLKRCTLELGGKSAAIVLDDADPARTAKGLRFAAFVNNGQACAAQTRVLAPRSRYAEIVDALVDAISSFEVGDPLDPRTEIGPLVNERQQARVAEYIRLGVAEGARAAVGGPDAVVPPGGCYVAPTLFVDADNHMRIAQEEIFGPVLTVIPYDTEEDAIRLANDSIYGLGGSVWTADQARAVEVAREIRTGMVGVNSFGPGVDMPFGGFKSSGIGREYGAEGLAAYVELKVVHGLRSPAPGGTDTTN